VPRGHLVLLPAQGAQGLSKGEAVVLVLGALGTIASGTAIGNIISEELQGWRKHKELKK
jgi:uncharacterized protein YoaH (UPF0181 family)